MDSLTLNFSVENAVANGANYAASYNIILVYKTDEGWAMLETGDSALSGATATDTGSLTVTGLSGLADDDVYVFAKTWGSYTYGLSTINLSMTASVPEPATAALSLLALAGLAARRRK